MLAPALSALAPFSVQGATYSKGELVVSDPVVLQTLENRGFDFATQLDRQAPDLTQSPYFASMTKILLDDVAVERRSVHAIEATYREPVAYFEGRFLTSPKSRFELVGITHRYDRAYTISGLCHETRLLYRLAYETPYQGEKIHSRLPMTVAIVYPVRGEQGKKGCLELARRSAFDPAWGPAKIAAHLEAVPFMKRIREGSLDFSRLEINLQSARLPYASRGTFSEQSHYIMRVFTRDEKRRVLRSAKLENSPDVERLNARPALKQRLLEWLKEPANLALIDTGHHLIPEEFLTERGLSVTPFGMFRRANRPFRALFEEEDFAGLDFGGLAVVKSPKALLRRLDSFTCVGCHQSHAIAGFHFLGFERTAESRFNSLRKPFSLYFSDILEWRSRQGPGSLNPRPWTERVRVHEGFGELCGLGDPGFADWTCPNGNVCAKDFGLGEDSGLGRCRAPETQGRVGSACDLGVLKSRWNPLLDAWTEAKTHECGPGAICATTRNGFAAGLCSRLCREDLAGAACVPVPLLGPFTQCLLDKKTFRTCLARHSTLALMKKCRAPADCRADYACVNAAAGFGICAPPYVMPQLTVEHHPPF